MPAQPYRATLNQIDIGTLRTDVGSVVAPAQPWVTLNNGTYVDSSINQPVTITNNPVMQMTFNVHLARLRPASAGA